MWASILLCAVATAMSMAVLATLTPTRLRCEYLANPVGINESAPRLSWALQSTEKGDRQTEYRILVASTRANLDDGIGDMWDSGSVASDETVNIAYRGTPLASGQRVWWSVQVTDKDGGESEWADCSWWEKGIEARDWHAKWIGRPDPAKPKLEIGKSKWIWFPEG